MNIWEIATNYYQYFLRGTQTTILISLLTVFCGSILGCLIAFMRLSKFKPLEKFASIYITVIRGTPMLVQALLLHYGFLSKMDKPLLSAFIIISLNTGAYMAEIVRGGIISIDKGQFEGSQAIGMTHFQTMFHVVLPQAVRNIMPSIGNEFVVNIKDSSILSVISITELMFMAKSAGGSYFQFIPAYLICAVIYFILTFTVTRLLRILEKKMDGNKNYTVFGSQSDPEAEIHIKEN